MPPAGGPDRKGGGNFLLGLMAGILITAMVGSCAYIGVRVYLLATGKAARITAGSDSTSDNLVSEETIKKLEALEEVIEEYYYKEEDINTETMMDCIPVWWILWEILIPCIIMKKSGRT